MALRAMGPSTNSEWNGSFDDDFGSRPGLGLNPVTPQKEAGVLRLPPRSDP